MERLLRELVYASLTYLTCEYLETREIEHARIWKWPQTATSAGLKLIFVWLRYAPFFIQFLDLWQISRFVSGGNSPSTCNSFYLNQQAMVQITVSCMEIVLAFRVYATYHGNKLVAIVLASVIVAEVIFNWVIIVKIKRVTQFNDHCGVLVTSALYVYVGYAMIISQSVVAVIQVVGLWLRGYFRSPRPPVLTLLMRDQVITLIIIVAFVTSCVVFIKYLIFVTFYFIITIVSTISCRLVLNVQALSAPEEPAVPLGRDLSGAPAFTTVDGLAEDPQQTQDPGYFRAEPNGGSTDWTSSRTSGALSNGHRPRTSLSGRGSGSA